MNAVVLPGVTLADKTIVGAGAVVTKSSLVPGLTLVGVPAKPMQRNSDSSPRKYNE
jgi:serine O-acetyltransferase